ncbi:MAG: TonB-dependent receptor [Alphaproteobacteria bacterium]|nr:TonB-dependent receptor [Alphaproteobacteria bacterium]
MYRKSLLTALVGFIWLIHFAEYANSTDKILEELVQTEVTSVSKTPENPFQSAAAVYVLTRDDIERSGATTIPEALRLVPGLEVARSSSNQWSITARGFNGGFSNKLLVMIDGRTVYTPLFSGVYWGVQDTLLQDIKQIEVVLGPGGTLWGANAVNGVINIITEEAVNTQSKIISVKYGIEEQGTVEGRYGGRINDNLFYRVYAKHADRNDLRSLNNDPAHDEWDMSKSGFRADYTPSESDNFTYQGDIYYSNQDLDLFLPNLPSKDRQMETLAASGGNFLTKWEHTQDSGATSTLQAYYDRTRFDYSQLDQTINTLDIDWQYNQTYSERHQIVWGLGYRLIFDNLRGSQNINFNPKSDYFNIFSTFLQDKITLKENLFFTLGSKFEHNDFSGFEIEPTARVSWLPTHNQTLWAAISRAVRTPSRAEASINLTADTFGGFAYVNQHGSNQFDSESMLAYEVGYRVKPSNDTSLNASIFYDDYSHLRSAEIGTPTAEPRGLTIPIIPLNLGFGEAYGFELSGDWHISPRWKLTSGYTFLELTLHTKAGSTDSELQKDENRSPQNQFNLRSQLNLPHDIQWDVMGYYVGSIKATDNNGVLVDIPSYFRLDTRLGWRFSPNLSFDLVGQNLLDSRHPEFSGALFSVSEQVERSAYGKVTFKF